MATVPITMMTASRSLKHTYPSAILSFCFFRYGGPSSGHGYGPWRGLDDVEYATLEWVAWFHTCRLLEPLGYLPPAEYEAKYVQSTTTELAAVGLN